MDCGAIPGVDGRGVGVASTINSTGEGGQVVIVVGTVPGAAVCACEQDGESGGVKAPLSV